MCTPIVDDPDAARSQENDATASVSRIDSADPPGRPTQSSPLAAARERAIIASLKLTYDRSRSSSLDRLRYIFIDDRGWPAQHLDDAIDALARRGDVELTTLGSSIIVRLAS